MKPLDKSKSVRYSRARPAYTVDDLFDDYEEYEERMREAFKAMLAFDEDKNGTLDMAEFTAFVMECGLLKGAEEEGQAILREIFESADANDDEELTFQEFAVSYNQLMDFREDMDLPRVDLVQAVTQYLQRKVEALAGGVGCAGDSSPGPSRTQSGSQGPPTTAKERRLTGSGQQKERRATQKDDNRAKALTMMGEQNVAIMIVEVFDSIETTGGKVPSRDFVSKLHEQGFINVGVNTAKLPCDVDVIQVLGIGRKFLGLPSVSKPKLFTLLENARRYLKQVKYLKRSCAYS